MSLGLHHYLTQIFTIDQALNKIDETNAQVDRLIFSRKATEDIRETFFAVSKIEERGKNSLGNSFLAINAILEGTLEEIANKTFEQISLSKLAELDNRVAKIKKWANQSLTNYDERWKFLHWIPFSKWRQTWLANQEHVHSEYAKMRTKIDELEHHSSDIKKTFALQEFNKLSDSLKIQRENFVNEIREHSEKIRELMHDTQTECKASDIQERLFNISSELSAMEGAVQAFKKFATKTQDNFVHTLAKAVHPTPFLTTLNISFCTPQPMVEVKSSYLENIPREDADRANREIQASLDEITKLTEAAIFFAEKSFPDVTQVFFTPAPDPEQGSTEREPSIRELIEKKLVEARLLVKHCYSLMEANNETDEKEADINVGQPNKAGIILAYMQAQNIVEICKNTLRAELSKLPQGTQGWCLQGNFKNKINKLKGDLVETTRQLELKQIILKQQTNKLGWFKLIGFIFKKQISQIEEDIRKNKADAQKLSNTQFSYKQYIAKAERQESSYIDASAAYMEFTDEFDELSKQMRTIGFITPDNKPMGEVQLTLTNPASAGVYALPTHELPDLANAYNRYIYKLEKLKENSAKATVAFSSLMETITESTQPA